MRLFTELDCEHFRACLPAEVGEAWVPRWTVDDLDAGLCVYRDLGKDKPLPPPVDETPPPPVGVSSPPAPFGGGVPLLLPSNVDEFRQAQIEELWAAAFALRPAVLGGDRQAADSFVKIHDRLAKLSGTDAPKTNITYIGGSGSLASYTDAELMAIVQRGEEERRQGMTLQQGEDGAYAAD